MSDRLQVGKTYWWHNGLFWTALELRNVYKNGTARLVQRASDGKGNWFEVRKTLAANLIGPTIDPVGTMTRTHPILRDGYEESVKAERDWSYRP